MPMIKANSGFQAVLSVFFTFLFLISAINIYAVDPTNRLDFNGDGKADIAYYREGNQNRSTADYTQSNFYYLDPINGTIEIQWGRTLDVPIPADYDGDGRTDVSIFRWFDPFAPPFDFNQIWTQTNPAPLPSPAPVPVVLPVRGFGNASGRKMARNFVQETGKNPQKAEVGEFQRTFIPEVSTSSVKLYRYAFYYQKGEGLVGKETLVPAGAYGTYLQVPVPEDYNGDGVSQIAVFDVTNRCYHVWERDPATGDPVDLPLPKYCFDPGYDTPVPGDYDGNGAADYAAIKITDSNGGKLVQWKINGISGTPQIQLANSSPNIKPVVADYDGDGITDLAVVQANGSSWKWTIIKSNCSGIACFPTTYSVDFGLVTDVPLASPYFYDPWY